MFINHLFLAAFATTLFISFPLFALPNEGDGEVAHTPSRPQTPDEGANFGSLSTISSTELTSEQTWEELYLLGNQALKDEYPEEALQFYKRASHLHIEAHGSSIADPVFYAARGRAALNTHQFSKAKKYFKKALRQGYPNIFNLQSLIAHAAYESGSYEEASSYGRAALRSAPEFLAAFYSLAAHVRIHEKQYSSAKKFLLKAISVYPEAHTTLHWNLIMCAIKDKKWRESMQYTNCLLDKTTDPTVKARVYKLAEYIAGKLSDRAVSEEQQESWNKEAAQYYIEALRYNPRLTEPVFLCKSRFTFYAMPNTLVGATLGTLFRTIAISSLRCGKVLNATKYFSYLFICDPSEKEGCLEKIQRIMDEGMLEGLDGVLADLEYA